ncbi:alpha-amylase family glycosyl hydrolase [Bacillus sp. 2205SS5-2]|uniref:alpha-amylase family glycosyl hydrolase n=1 Tax=Bacillus sp. 2205SS5-2 TaxID=3109031 RepID=UPI00300669A8
MKRRFSFLLIPFLLFYALPTGAAEKEERRWQDETMYFIMVDRFLNEENNNDFDVNLDDPRAYHGGDFKGIMSQLDYIQEMGFTSIWLTPIFNNEDKGYHGYWISDFYNTEEHFGTLEEFKLLVEEAHKRDLKVVLDFVVNHVGPNHEWVSDPEKSNWLHDKKSITNWKDDADVQNSWLYDLPDLNTENPDVQEYLFEAAKWWIEETNIDGYRLDTVRHVPAAFWEKFAQEVKSVNKDFYLLGEVYDKDPKNIAKYAETGIDGFVDFPQNDELRNVFKTTDIPLDRLPNYWNYNETFYKDPYLMGTFIDNHDMSRFTMLAAEENQFPPTRWKQALAYMYTVPGIPIVYYGSEIALNGGEDPDNRRLMNFKTDKDLIEYITKLGQLRQDLPALTRGTIEEIDHDGTMLVYKRKFEDETIIVAINDSSETQTIKINAAEFDQDKELRGLLAGDKVNEDNGVFSIVLDRETTEIYAVADESGLNIGFISALTLVYVLFLGFIYLIWKQSRKKRLEKK